MSDHPDAEPSLQSRFALVTGGSGGIGAAVALRLARRGAHVALTYLDHRAEAEAVAKQIRDLGRRAVAWPCDLAAPSVAGDLVERCRDFLFEPDILVANAGIGPVRRWDEVDIELWQRSLAVNLTAPFLLAQAMLPAMIARRYGRVLFMSSTAALTGGIVGPHYAAGKAGLHGLTHHLAAQVAPDGVTVNTLAPMLIDGTRILPPEVDRARLARDLPVGRLGDVGEVAAMAEAILCNGYLTSKVITLDGGAVPR
jgi:3-oxoacyl-[acyl-carrier protein] reductase